MIVSGYRYTEIDGIINYWGYVVNAVIHESIMEFHWLDYRLVFNIFLQ